MSRGQSILTDFSASLKEKALALFLQILMPLGSTTVSIGNVEVLRGRGEVEERLGHERTFESHQVVIFIIFDDNKKKKTMTMAGAAY